MLTAWLTLFQGSSPLADRPLDRGEQVAIRAALDEGEEQLAFLRGRDARGWWLWVLTPSRLVQVRQSGRGSARSQALEALRAAEAVPGKWGTTVRADGAREQWYLIGAAPGLARALMDRLEAEARARGLAVAVRCDELPMERDEAPVQPVGASDGDVALERLAALRQSGVLSDDEYGALMRRMNGDRTP